jgi:exodeoxyribonuclease VII small subunit
MPAVAKKPESEPAQEIVVFEPALAELEKVARELEDGSLDLAAALARYEQGITLLRRCYQELEKAEQRIELLAGLDAEGKPRTEEFRE